MADFVQEPFQKIKPKVLKVLAKVLKWRRCVMLIYYQVEAFIEHDHAMEM